MQNNLSRKDQEDWQIVWENSCQIIWFWRNQREHVEDYIFPNNLAEDIWLKVRNYHTSLIFYENITIDKVKSTKSDGHL